MRLAVNDQRKSLVVIARILHLVEKTIFPSVALKRRDRASAVAGPLLGSPAPPPRPWLNSGSARRLAVKVGPAAAFVVWLASRPSLDCQPVARDAPPRSGWGGLRQCGNVCGPARVANPHPPPGAWVSARRSRRCAAAANDGGIRPWCGHSEFLACPDRFGARSAFGAVAGRGSRRRRSCLRRPRSSCARAVGAGSDAARARCLSESKPQIGERISSHRWGSGVWLVGFDGMRSGPSGPAVGLVCGQRGSCRRGRRARRPG
jgi:hypothetical protein